MKFKIKYDMEQKLEQKLHYGKAVIEYSIIKTKRRKTSEIIVDKDTIEVRAPFNKPDYEIQKIVQDKASWILKKQKEYREMNPQISRPTFKEDSTLPYLGKNYPLRIFYRQVKNGICFADGKFIITLLSSLESHKTRLMIEKLYQGWLMKIARPVFKNKVGSFSDKVGVSKPERIIIKKLLCHRDNSLLSYAIIFSLYHEFSPIANTAPILNSSLSASTIGKSLRNSIQERTWRAIHIDRTCRRWLLIMLALAKVPISKSGNNEIIFLKY